MLLMSDEKLMIPLSMKFDDGCYGWTQYLKALLQKPSCQRDQFWYLWVNSPEVISDLFSYLICYIMVQ